LEDDRPKHFCGVVAMALEGDVVPHLKKALRIIQHRGQEAAGIAVHNGKSVSYHRGMGLVHEVLNGRQYNSLMGNAGIGHVRYSTEGGSCSENIQPIVVTTKEGDLALAHNGDIVNAPAIRTRLQAEGWAFLTSTDSEIVVRMMATEVSFNPDPVRAIKTVMRALDGAYSITLMLENRIFGFRDPYGFRPLCFGRLPGGYALASESSIFEVMNGEFIRDVLPGEIVEITSKNFTSTRTPAAPHTAHCMFEWVYFARPDAIINGREVYQVRINIGHILAKEQPAQADVVIPVPDSGRAHALGYAEGSGIPYAEGFMKNRYIERTFIMPDQSQRDEGVLLKLNPIRSTVQGKRVVIADDSIVRGTTMRKIVQMTRRAGAKEVHVRIGCPPVIAPCFYGVDMKTREQFAALNRTPEQIAKLITADSVGFISQEGLVRALGIPESELCLACVNGLYPTKIPGERMRFQRTLEIT
jgi:amidophosphoribosyltransferase